MKRSGTRRQVLATAGGLIVGSAGCLQSRERDGNESTADSTSTDSATGTRDSPTVADATETAAGPDPVPVGSILPTTGDLRSYGPKMETAVELAVEDLNEAGGPLGRELRLHSRDSETDPESAVAAYDSLVDDQGVVGVVGAASSRVTMALAENVADDEVMQVTNASTSPVLGDVGDAGDTRYVARTAPNDAQMGVAMAEILDRYVAADSAAFLYVDQPYGRELARAAEAAFPGETLHLVPYSSETSDYTATLDELFRGDPDGVGFVGYPMSGKSILETWADGDYGGEWVLSEGLNVPAFFRDLGEVAGGMYVASPAPATTRGATRFRDKLGEEPSLFVAHAYDALVLQALAMHAAGEASGTAIARNVRSVSRPDGVDVTVGEFDRAFSALADGRAVNYEGASGTVDLTASLDTLYRYEILQVGNDGDVEIMETIPRAFFLGKL